MRKILVFALCVIGFMFIAAPTATEYHQVFLNGKPFARARVFNGEAAVSVKAFATAAGQVITLEPSFSLIGSNLNAAISGYSTPAGIKLDPAGIKMDPAGAKMDPAGIKMDPAAIKLDPAEVKMDPAGIKMAVPTDQLKYKEGQPAKKAVLKDAGRAMFKVNKPGPISTRVFNADGEMWIPLADIANAFKGHLSPNAAPGGTLKVDEAIQLTFTSNPNAVLIGL